VTVPRSIASEEETDHSEGQPEHEEQHDEEDQTRNLCDQPVGDHLQRPEREREHASRQTAGPRELRQHEPDVDEGHRQKGEGPKREEHATKRAPDSLGPHDFERLNPDRLDPRPKPPVEQEVEPPPGPEHCHDRNDQRRGGAQGVEGIRPQSAGRARLAVVNDGQPETHQMDGGERASRYLLKARIGIDDGHDHAIVRHETARTLTVDHAQRINGNRRICGHCRQSLFDETCPLGRRQRRGSAHGEEHGAVQFDRGRRDFPFDLRIRRLLCEQRSRARQRGDQEQRQ
jgi:hypothetical protein